MTNHPNPDWKAMYEAAVTERDEARKIVADCNNSLFGSQGYFTAASGKTAAQAIEDLKRYGGDQWQRAERAEASLQPNYPEIPDGCQPSDRDDLAERVLEAANTPWAELSPDATQSLMYEATNALAGLRATDHGGPSALPRRPRRQLRRPSQERPDGHRA